MFTPEKRSYVMSRIRGKNTKIESIMRELLKSNKIKSIQHPSIFGKPDFLVGKKTLIFCDGDFWHGYNYHGKRKPPRGFWQKKILGNMKRDIQVSRKLRYQGYSVLRFWEHDLEKRSEVCMNRIRRFMK